MTSSPQRSTGVETDDVTQPPAVQDPLSTDAGGSSAPSAGLYPEADVSQDADAAPAPAPAQAPDADADADAVTVVRDAVGSDDDKIVDGGAGRDEGPATDPHGLPPVEAGDESASEVAPETGSQQAPALVPPPAPEQQSRVRPAVRRTGKVRKARLRLLRVEPWSVMKSAFVLSIAIGITLVVAAATLWSVIDAAGVFEVVGTLITDLTESESSAGIELQDYVGFSRVVGLATVIAVIDVVLLTALATLFAFLYNLSAALLGGFEVTLAEDD